MENWAKKEIEIAKKRERGDNQNDCCDYGCACYDFAYKAFQSLLEDGHSGFSIKLTQNILNRLIDGKPLTPIEDTDDVWNEREKNNYQCKRMSSLFKKIKSDGSIKYSDVNRVVCIDIKSGTSWSNGYSRKIIDEKYPITMPYYPSDKPYKIYSEDFLYLRPDEVGSYDHKAYLYMIKPDGEREEINKYYMDTNEGMLEISKEIYDKHKEETYSIKNGNC